jgi:hypothetical protein
LRRFARPGSGAAYIENTIHDEWCAMITLNKRLAGLALGFAVAVSAWPSFAQTDQDPNFARRPQDRKRMQAVQECMAKAGKMKTYADTIGQTEAYKSCMIQRGYRP